MAASPAASAQYDTTTAFDAEAQQLALWLRTRRFSALIGAAGGERAALVRAGVMPMLHRRASDAPRGMPATASRVVIPFPDRRRRGLGTAAGAEVAVLFDEWRSGVPPLSGLIARAHAAIGLPAPDIGADARLSLGGSLAGLNMQSGARFLLILDRFEECLLAASQDAGARDFIDELILALKRPLLPVHVLVCASDDAAGPLADLFARVPGTDEHALRLGEEAAPAPAAPEPPPSDEEWLVSIGAIVARVADSARQDSTHQQRRRAADPILESPATPETPEIHKPMARMGRVVAPPSVEPPAAEVPGVDVELDLSVVPETPSIVSAAAAPEPVPATADEPSMPASAGVGGASARYDGRRIGAVAVVVVGLVAALSVWQWRSADSSSEAPVATVPAPTRTPAPVPTPALTPAAVLPVAPSSHHDVERELAAALSDDPTPIAGPLWPAGFTAVAGRPSLAVAHYDALLAARALPSRPPLQIVAPLYREALQFIVRADSPLNGIGDVRGAAMNIGAADSARAISAEAAYLQMFGAAPTPVPTSALDTDAALGALLGGHGVDVMVMVGPPSSPWLAQLPAATRSALRVLPADPARPEVRRAMQLLLPMGLPQADGRAGETPTLGEMTFLVAVDDAEAGRAAAALCRQLPALQRDGSPAWRELAPGQVLPTGWPTSPAAQQAWQSCAAPAR